ncbi:TPA: integrating conjugative element protein [Escherichia coli]|nr:integrating conjugative element protein [Escherichia coli]HBH5051481.1 integrating conjugative element protein [Escherichia coli]HBH5189662.1 integrating conjugative element protein [Escherichia coli]HEA1258174.1 integrating conjugative element protein [Escherichia coli]
MLKLCLYIIIFFSFQTSATLVWRTNQESESVSRLLMGINLSLTTGNVSELHSSSEPSRQGGFPVICTQLHPGTVTKRQLLTGWGPVFIIGDDPFSLRWMSEHLEKFKSLNALGLVVNVASADRMELLNKQADGLLLVPVVCDNLMQLLQLNAYPVLITETEISQ